MEEKKDLSDFNYPVHRSLMKRRLIMGIPFVPLLFVVIITALIVMDLKIWQIIPLSIFVLFIIREITKKDEYFMEILIASLFQPEKLN